MDPLKICTGGDSAGRALFHLFVFPRGRRPPTVFDDLLPSFLLAVSWNPSGGQLPLPFVPRPCSPPSAKNLSGFAAVKIAGAAPSELRVCSELGFSWSWSSCGWANLSQQK